MNTTNTVDPFFSILLKTAFNPYVTDEYEWDSHHVAFAFDNQFMILSFTMFISRNPYHSPWVKPYYSRI